MANFEYIKKTSSLRGELNNVQGETPADLPRKYLDSTRECCNNQKLRDLVLIKFI